MIKFRPHEFYLAAVYLHPVLELPDESDRNLYISRIVGARCALSVFTGGIIDAVLPLSKKRADWLMRDIDRVTFNKDIVMGLPNLESLKDAIRKFETVLDEEISAAPIFCLERIGNLSTDSLLEGASKGYAPNVLKILPPNYLAEIDESGRCLGFERATASGYHILRAVELTIRRYLLLIPGFVMPRLNRQNWGEFIDLLNKNGASKPVIDTLHNIKVNYRNPLMHPEDTLELREAISLFCVCQGMIEILVNEIYTRGLDKYV